MCIALEKNHHLPFDENHVQDHENERAAYHLDQESVLQNSQAKRLASINTPVNSYVAPEMDPFCADDLFQ